MITERTRNLRARVSCAKHAALRTGLDPAWNTSNEPLSLIERKAEAFRRVLAGMPVAIGQDELIVGTRTVLDSCNLMLFPEYLNEEERARPAEYWGEWHTSHNVPGYATALHLGFGGIRREAVAALEGARTAEERQFLGAVITAYEGASQLSRRYAALALSLAEDSDASPDRAGELRRIADVCLHIADEPPRDLHEALQVLWFAHLAVLVENGTLVAIGRFDRMIGSFWPDRPSEGDTQLLEAFLIKMNDQYDIQPGPGHTSNNLILSGLTPAGEDGTNALTYACLDAMERLGLPEPVVAVRLHEDSPRALVRRCAELVQAGFEQLSFLNDDAFADALTAAGFPEEDAREYAIDACQDVIIAGKSDFYVAGGVWLTPLFLDVFDRLAEDAGFDTVLNALKDAITQAVNSAVEGYRATVGRPPREPLPMLSGLMDDCIARRRDMTAGGLRYRDRGVMLGSPVNMINSLAALRKVVYEDKLATLAEVREACRCNFEGHEQLQRQLLAAPKWGNDDPFVDDTAVDVLEFACREIQKHRIDEGARFLSGIHQAHHVASGRDVRATPDGRRAKESFPVTLAPVNGTAANGPTAVMLSVTKISHHMTQWNQALTLPLDPSSLGGEGGLERFEALLETYLRLRGPQLQVNAISVERLEDALGNPERHRDLVVRVWGFCARFVDLPRMYQEDLIERARCGLKA